MHETHNADTETPGDGRVAVVVATYDRPAHLRRLIESLLAQDLSESEFEIVIVDNGSGPETAEVLAELAQAGGDRLRSMRIEDNRGPARARNLGWTSSRARWIAFTDDDCTARPSWLRELRTAASEGAIVQGRTVPAGPLPTGRPWAKSVHITRPTNRFETCNLLVPRDLLERTGGFDERFPVAAGEDADLGWRALGLGATVDFASDAVVEHVVWDRSFVEYLRSRRRWAHTALAFKKHPGLREVLAFGFLYRRNHALVLVGLPAAVALSRSPARPLVPLAAAAWVARATLHHRRRLGTVRSFSYAIETLVGAAWEVAVFSEASLRYRTIVL